MNILFLLKPKVNVAYIMEESTVRQGLEKMKVHGYTAIPVLNRDGEYVGTVSEGDFLRHLLSCPDKTLEAQENYSIMDIVSEERNKPVTISADMNDLLHIVMDQNFVPVIDDKNSFIGIITRRDVIKFFCDRDCKLTEMLKKTVLSD